MVNALVFWPLKIFQTHIGLAISLMELLDAAPGIPLWFERRQGVGKLTEIHSIAPFIWLRACGIFNAAVWYQVFDNLREVADLIIFFIASHIESLVVDHLTRRMQDRDESP